MVLVHGRPVSGESSELQVPALQEVGHRVVTCDRRGPGRSDQPLAGYGYDRLTQDLHSILE